MFTCKRKFYYNKKNILEPVEPLAGAARDTDVQAWGEKTPCYK